MAKNPFLEEQERITALTRAVIEAKGFSTRSGLTRQLCHGGCSAYADHYGRGLALCTECVLGLDESLLYQVSALWL